MKKLLILVGLIIFYLNPMNGQSPYELDAKKDVNLILASVELHMLDFWLGSKVQELSYHTIQNELVPENINALDRFATNHYSNSSEQRSDLAMYLPFSTAVISSLLIPNLSKSQHYYSDIFTLFVIGLETNLINTSITYLCKNSINRIRPYVYNPNVPINIKTNKDSRRSFFSTHTSFSASNAFLTAKLFSDYYPESNWKPLIWSFAIALPAWTGIERVLAGKHFPTDVLTGYLVGAACGYLIPEMHKKKGIKPTDISITPFYGAEMKGLAVNISF